VVRPGAGLELTANYSQGLPGLSDDSQGSLYHSASVGLSAVTPWGLYSGSYSGTRYRIGQSAAPFYPDGEIAIWGATGTQLAYADEAGRLTLNESFTRTSNVVTVLDGATTITDQHYDFVSAGASFNRAFAAFGANASLAASVTVSKGLSAPAGSFLLAGAPDTRFALVQGSVNYTQALPMGYAAGLSWSGQWADATVPQNQQWVLGGFGNLTAWLPAVLVGDIGTLARASVSTPAWTWSGLSLTGGAFVEGGTAQRHITPIDTPVSRGLADAGLSVSGNLKGGTSLLVAYAWPIASHNLGQDALDRLDRAHLYFSLNQSF
jgi:hemolysin activation/secretion protein